MKDRNIICQFYVEKHDCTKGYDASIDGKCQKCKKYRPKPGAQPFRVDTRGRKIADARKKDERYE